MYVEMLGFYTLALFVCQCSLVGLDVAVAQTGPVSCPTASLSQMLGLWIFLKHAQDTLGGILSYILEFVVNVLLYFCKKSNRILKVRKLLISMLLRMA